jgi:hypothetical protein
MTDRGATVAAGGPARRGRRRGGLDSREMDGRDRRSGRDPQQAMGAAHCDRRKLAARLSDAVRQGQGHGEREQRLILRGWHRGFGQEGCSGGWRHGSRGGRRGFTRRIFVGRSRSAGGRLRAFPRSLGGFGARFSGLFGRLFIHHRRRFFDRRGFFGHRRLLFDRGRGFYGDRRRLGGGRGRGSCFFSRGWPLLGGRRSRFSRWRGFGRWRSFDRGRRLFGRRRGLFSRRRGLFGRRRGLFGRRDGFLAGGLFSRRRRLFIIRRRFANRRFRGAAGRASARVGVSDEQKRRE